jgi:hypothetical protein
MSAENLAALRTSGVRNLANELARLAILRMHFVVCLFAYRRLTPNSVPNLADMSAVDSTGSTHESDTTSWADLLVAARYPGFVGLALEVAVLAPTAWTLWRQRLTAGEADSRL